MPTIRVPEKSSLLKPVPHRNSPTFIIPSNILIIVKNIDKNRDITILLKSLRYFFTAKFLNLNENCDISNHRIEDFVDDDDSY